MSLLVLAACGRAELEVEADALPGRYPNQLASTERELQFALLSPPPRAAGYPLSPPEPGSDLPVTPNAELAVARTSDGREGVSNIGPLVWRDVDGDGVEDIVASFSTAELRAAGLLSSGRLRVDVQVAGQAIWTGSDRVFAPEASIVSLPEPSGSHAVGTISDLLLDRSRHRVRELGRPLYVRAWYPALSAGQPTDYLLVPETERAIAQSLGIRGDVFDTIHASSIRAAAPATDALYPTLLLSTGSGVPLDFYAALAEDLASHGFVVVGVGHPDGISGPIAYADGSVSEDLALSALTALEPTEQPTTERLALEQQLVSAANLACAQDLLFVLDCLAPGADCGLSPALRSALASADLQRVGALGHSFGGSAAVWADLLSDRIRASANLDGALWGAPLDQAWTSRVLVLQSDDLVSLQEQSNLSQFLARARGTTYLAHVAGSTHNQFSDVGLLASSLAQLAESLRTSVLAAPRADSSLAPQRVLEIQNAYVRSFFSQELAGEESALLSGQQPEFPEVSLEIRDSIADASGP